jgi:glutamate transport system permease protein
MSTNSVLFDVPGPKARVRHTIVALVASVLLLGVLGWVVVRLHDKGQLTAAKWTPFVTAEIWTQYLLPGIGGTLLAAAISVALASVLGLMLGLGRLSDNAAIRAVSGVVTEFFRAVPVLMMMLFSYALYSQYGLFPSEQLALAGVVTGLTLYNGTVMAELLRSGVGSLPNGQREAGLAIGLSGSQTRRSILVPQAITAMLPSLVSQLVVILKDTALGYVITYEELLRKAEQIGNYKSNLIPAFIVVAALFVLVNYSVSLLARMVEQRMRSRGRTAGTVAAAEVIAVGGTAGVAEAEATSTSHRSAS